MTSLWTVIFVYLSLGKYVEVSIHCASSKRKLNVHDEFLNVRSHLRLIYFACRMGNMSDICIYMYVCADIFQIPITFIMSSYHYDIEG